MTEQEIDALPAGDDLDWAVAEQVLGWRQRMRWVTGELIGFEPPSDEGDHIIAHVPKFSTDIDAARTVFARLMDDGWCIADGRLFDDRGHLTSDPVAICRAALRAFKPRV